MNFATRTTRNKPAVPTRSLAVAGLALVALLGVAAPAQAHNEIVSTTPAAGSVVTEQPETISVTTSDALLEGGQNLIQVKGPDGLYFGDGCTTIDGTSAAAAVQLGAAGEYTVAYKIVSADGHPVSDSYTFTWKPAEDQELAKGHRLPPVCGQDAPEESTAPEPTDASTTQEPVASTPAPKTEKPPTSFADFGWVAGVLGMAIIAGSIVVLLVKRRPAPWEEGGAKDDDPKA